MRATRTFLHRPYLSGTSLDAVDAVLVQFNPLQLVASHSEPIPKEIRQNLNLLYLFSSCSISKLREIDVALGRLFSATSLNLLKKLKLILNQKRFMLLVAMTKQSIISPKEIILLPYNLGTLIYNRDPNKNYNGG